MSLLEPLVGQQAVAYSLPTHGFQGTTPQGGLLASRLVHFGVEEMQETGPFLPLPPAGTRGWTCIANGRGDPALGLRLAS